MEENVLERYDLARVNRFNTILIWAFSSILSLEGLLTMGPLYGLRVFLLTYAATLTAATAYYLNKKKYPPPDLDRDYHLYGSGNFRNNSDHP